MKVMYREGQKLVLAEANKIEIDGPLIRVALLTSGEPEYVVRPFPNAEVCEKFFREVIAQPGDHIINLENTAFDLRLSALFDELDALYED